MSGFLKRIETDILVLDGAMGTMLQERGLAPGGCPEEMNLKAPEVVAGIHREYAEAGSDIVLANTFGGSRTKLANYGLENKVAEINRRAVEIARDAVGPNRLVAASIGPTGRFVEPVGDATFDEMVEIFAEQIQAFVAAGADLVTLETFLDIKEIRAAAIAAREFSDLPILAMMTFDDGGRTVLGTPPAAAAVTLDPLVDVIGSNCGLGIEGMVDILEKMRASSARPLVVQANAGLPVMVEGETVFPGTPDEMIAYHDRLIELGVRVIGGCCGTTPQHIRAIREALASRDTAWSPSEPRCFLSSRSRVIPLGSGAPCAIIGERINPTGKKKYSAELLAGKTAYIRREAQSQVEAGADLLDINCGAPGVDEPAALKRAVIAASGVAEAPLVLDSSDPLALEEGLKAVDGKVLINSVSGESKSIEAILPLARKYGAAVIGLTLDQAGIPESAEGRLEVARNIMLAADEAGLCKQNLLVDCLTLTVSAEQKRALETLKALRLVQRDLGLTTVLGVSNISFGLPARPILSSAFFAMALEAGLGAAIINPLEERMMDAYRAAMVLLGSDERAEKFVGYYGGTENRSEKTDAKEIADLMVRDRLAMAVIDGDDEGIVALIEAALGEGMAPLEISNEGLLPGLEEVGRRFGRNQIFLPQVMRSAETMQKAFARLKEEMEGQQGSPLARILMATVEGDIHDIGKNIVCTLLENHGFEVIDLGKNVPAQKIIDKALELKVDAVGLSALMTTTLQQMENTIEALQEAGVKVVTLVGGAVVTEDYAEKIGADAYAEDALDAVAKVKELFRQKT